MKTFPLNWIFPAVLSWAALCAAPAGFAADAFPHALLFQNGDAMPGRVESLIPGKELRWIHPDSEEPILFKTDNLAQIANRQTRQPRPAGKHPCVVQFTNADQMTGDLTQLNATNLILETWHAGTVTVPRNRVRLIRMIPTHFKTLFSGPSGLAGWTMGDVSIKDAGVWTFGGDAFYATKAASIARDIQLPDQSTLEFDIAWQETFNFAIALYTDYLHPISLRNKELGPPFGGFYSLQISARTVNLLHVTKHKPLRYLGPLAIRSFDGKSTAHITIKCDKPRRSVSLFIDGEPVKQWIDDTGFGGEGTGIRLVHQGAGSMRLSNLRATEWDGRFDAPPSLPPNGGQDAALLANRQRVFGSVQSIKDGKIFVQTAEGLFNTRWQNTIQVELAPAKAAALTPPIGHSRAWFDNRRSVSVKLEKWEGDRITASSPNFGTLKFDAAAFRQFEFSKP
jgi:hypothetical protein